MNDFQHHPEFTATLSRMDIWLDALAELPVDDEESALAYAMELELYEGNLYAVIFEYCLDKGYSFEGFPQYYLTENEEEEDKITYERMAYYIWHTALETPDVFALIRKLELWANPEISDEEIAQELSARLLELGPVNVLFDPPAAL